MDRKVKGGYGRQLIPGIFAYRQSNGVYRLVHVSGRWIGSIASRDPVAMVLFAESLKKCPVDWAGPVRFDWKLKRQIKSAEREFWGKVAKLKQPLPSPDAAGQNEVEVLAGKTTDGEQPLRRIADGHAFAFAAEPGLDDEPGHEPCADASDVEETSESRSCHLQALLLEVFGGELTEAAFRWIDAELSALPPRSPFAAWWSVQRSELIAGLPANLTRGSIPKTLSVSDDLKYDLCRFILLEELFYELSHGPADGIPLTSGDKVLGTLPPLDGGWGTDGVWASAVLRWVRGWVVNPNQDSAQPGVATQSAAVALEDAKRNRFLECLHDEIDLQQKYAAWCEEQNLPNVVVRGPYRNRDEPDGLLFLVGLDLSRTTYRLNRDGLDVSSQTIGVKSWGASGLPDDQIPDTRFSRIATASYLLHAPAAELAQRWLEIALDPEYVDMV